MLKYLNFFKLSRLDIVGASLCFVLVIILTPNVYAQESDPFGDAADDSLLFGDEFDLGGDDFSFEFDEGEASDTPAEEGDDFFGDFEEETEESEVEATAEEDDWGLDEDSEDLFSDDSSETGINEEEYSDHPMDFRRNVHGTFMEGIGMTISFYSPQYVSDKMNTWYSYMDYSIGIELPWHMEVNPANISFILDISSFNFENSFPAGGSFNGVSIMPLVRAEVYGFEAEAGIGMYSPTFGLMAGLGYAYQYHSMFTSFGYRWNWAYEIDPIGSGWWLEPRFTAGIKLW